MQKSKLIAVILLYAIAPSYGQEVVDPELKSLIQKSISYFPRIKELEQQIEISDFRKEVVRAGYRPAVTGNALYFYQDPVPIIKVPTGTNTYNEIQTIPYSNHNANVSVNQLLYDFGKTRHLVEKSKYEILIAKDNLLLNKVTLAAQIASNYFSIIYLEKSIVVQDSVISYFTQYKKLIDNKIKRGDALEFDALTAQSNIDLAYNRKVDLQNLLQRQYNLLSYSSGESARVITSNKLLDFPLDQVSEDSLMNIARLGNREIAVAKSRMLSQEEELAAARKNFLPTLNLNGGVGFRNGYQPDILQTRFNFLIGAGLSIPIYTGNRNQNQLKISESTLLASRYAAQGVEAAVKRDMDQAMADIQASSDRLRNIESQISQSVRALQLAQSRFKNGTITYVELLNSQTNVQQVYLSKLRYSYELTLAKVEMARLMGLEYW